MDQLYETEWPAPAGSGAPTALGDLARRVPRLTQRMTAAHAALFLRSQGRALTRWFGSPVLVLETVGRCSGKPRATPLVYVPHRGDFAVVPANAGAAQPPAWWLNLQAAGEGFAVLGRERQRITPAIATGTERDRLWQCLSAAAPLEHYQQRTRRALPIVILKRAGDSAPLRNRAQPTRARARQHAQQAPAVCEATRVHRTVPAMDSATSITDAYMAAIKPFRHLIVYPPLMREIERRWRAGTRPDSWQGAAT